MTNPEILKKHLPIYGWHLPVIDAKEYIEAALEEAREDERNQGRGEGPVWVKAQDLNIGDIIKDEDGKKGFVLDSSDPHTIEVDFGRGRIWTYCIVENCDDYSELLRLKELDNK